MNLTTKKIGTFRSFDSTQLYFETRGNGEPLVFLYGIGCLMNHWLPQTNYFSKNFSVINYDYRAHQKSETPLHIETMTVESIAKDTIKLCKNLNLENTTFIGHSFGCQALMKVYELEPSLVKNLVFINGFASNPLDGMFGNDLASQAFDLIKSVFDLAPKQISWLWKLGVNNPISMYLSGLAGGFNLNLTQLKDIEIYARAIAHIDIEAFLTLFQDMIDFDGRPIFKTINVPTLIISGDHDSVTPFKYQEEMHRLIKNSEFLKVPMGSHCTQLDMPELVNLRIEKFLSEK